MRVGWAGEMVPWLRVLTAPAEPAFGPQNHVGLTMSWDSSHSSSLTVSSHTAGMSSGVLGILKRGKLMSGEELRTGCLLLVSSSVSGLLLFTFKHPLPEPKLSIPYFTSLCMRAVTADCWHMRQCRSHDLLHHAACSASLGLVFLRCLLIQNTQSWEPSRNQTQLSS